MLRLVAFIAVAAALATARPLWNQLDGYNFDRYIADFHRDYVKGSDEYKFREHIFNRRLAVIREHNKNSKHTWRRGVNLFTDMSEDEWKHFNRAYKSPNRPAPNQVYSAPANFQQPRSVDYRNSVNPRVLTDIKHQGSCGSCWAHSATESIESYYAITTGMLPVLSQQQITSCTGLGTMGCNGGDAVLAYTYLNTTYWGQTEEWAYPYTDFFFNYRDPNSTTSPCVNTTQKFPNKHRPYSWFAELNRAAVWGYGAIIPNNATATTYGLATIGPMSISVAAGNWQDYESGVMQNTNATGANNEWGIDHDVQLVGYGYDGDLALNYWIVRNSWSTLWGEAGYVRLFRAANPADEPCSPPEFGPVCGTSGLLNDPHHPNVVKNPGQKW